MATSLLFWPASAAVLHATLGPGVRFKVGTNFQHLSLAFDGADGSRDEFAYFTGVMPDSYGGGNVQFRLYWEPATGAPAGENCSWDVGILGRVDDEVLDAAASETQTVNDVVTAAADLQVAETTAAAATLAAGDFIVIMVSRDYDEANGGTALGEDAYLHGIQLLEA